MKVQKLIYNNYKFFILNLLNFSKNLTKRKICNVKENFFITGRQQEIYLKRVLRIIYEYHVNDRNILFIGFPVILISMFSEIIFNTKHFFTPVSSNFRKSVQSNFPVSNVISKKVFSKRKNFKIPDLIVVMGHHQEQTFLTEVKNFSIPILCLSNRTAPNTEISQKNSTIIYSLILCSIFKRTKKIKKYRRKFLNKLVFKNYKKNKK